MNLDVEWLGCNFTQILGFFLNSLKNIIIILWRLNSRTLWVVMGILNIYFQFENIKRLSSSSCLPPFISSMFYTFQWRDVWLLSSHLSQYNVLDIINKIATLCHLLLTDRGQYHDSNMVPLDPAAQLHSSVLRSSMVELLGF